MSEFIDTFVKFSNFMPPGVESLTPRFVPGGGVLYAVIVAGGGFLPLSSRIPRICPGGMVLDEIDSRITLA